MADVTTFLTVMAALSAAVQTLVEHVVKKNWLWLDKAKEGKEENRRHVAVHGIAFLFGAALAWSVGLEPLTYLGAEGGLITNALVAGVLVSYGGSFFDEALGAVREFKKAKEKVREARGS